MRLRLIALPVALAALIAATFAIALGALSEEPPRTAPAPAREPAPPTAPAAASEPQEAAAPATTRELFAHTCGACHTLADAGTTGMFGPDLDELQPSSARVRRMIRTGSLDGVMQPDLLRGSQAQRVADYVARVAGR